MPFVAVVGGLWQIDQAQLASAKAAGEQLGEELAKAGFGLVVYFSNDESLEPHVIAGFTRALPKGKGKIRVRFAESQRGKGLHPVAIRISLHHVCRAGHCGGNRRCDPGIGLGGWRK